MKKFMPAVICGAVLLAGVLLTNSVSYGKAEYTKKEKKACKTCHVQAAPKKGAEALNEVGKCYETKKSLADCSK